ncbi:MAG: DUF4349 domain-containing protein [Lachnospiraceae bacterium]|nr:DUF4349 domain-containing protein [Lachnospiraceae bacterium]
MKKTERFQKMRTLAVVLAAALTLAGCGSSKYDSAATAASDDYYDDYAGEMSKTAGAGAGESFAVNSAADYEESYDMDDVADEGSSSASSSEEVAPDKSNVAQNRKLIRRVNLTAETQEFDKLTRHIEQKVEQLGGYMESSDVNSGSSYSGYNTRHASYVARIPVGSMNELVEDVGQNANITSKSENAEDVTLQYVDNKSRKEALQVEYDRLMEILKQAEDVDTIVALESRITEVRYEIQNIESRLRTYDNLVDFATVNINVNEVEVYTPEPVKKVTNWERMTQGFVHSLQDVGNGILNFLINLVIALPYLFIWAIVIIIIVLICKKVIFNKAWREKRAAKKAAKAQAKAEKKAAKNPAAQTPQVRPEQQINLDDAKKDQNQQ